MKTLLWFRNDLRLADNPALTYACETGSELLLVYVLDPETRLLGDAQRWWLHHSLKALQADLKAHKASLLLLRGDSKKTILQLVAQHQIEQVCWNRVYEPQSIAVDTTLKAQLQLDQVKVVSFNRSLLIEPTQVFNKSGGYFKVYTPFYKHVLTLLSKPLLQPTPVQWPEMIQAQGETLVQWQLLPTQPNWAICFADWKPGERAAQQLISQYVEESVNDYNDLRNRPDLDATSRMSPYLHFGEMSPHQIWQALGDQGAEYFRQLIWREFAHYLLMHFPELDSANFKAQFDGFKWRRKPKWLKAWQQGLTGYPIVDAGMRQLWASGWMHNRVRMIVASFLTKDLLIDWRQGMVWFEHTLLDADVANNAMGWQWVAGSGPDAAPYFRIFNPTTQSQKFDPDGAYIRQWLPELAQLPLKYLHQPETAPDDVLVQAGITLGVDYPQPIVCHADCRQQALAMYKDLK